ncbi:MAG: alpha/beta hydrolase [Burkholderiales bacterium]|jgi:pimeloyl-ACP methyl ester carboxylesterase|nr:alpha/beta hydrolase [Burkholderiales bacterium]
MLESLYSMQLDGPPPAVVFLHGLGGTSRYWMAASAPLPRFGHRVRLVDLLGFGASPKPWFVYTVDRHLSALHGVLSDLDDVVIVGHSMGAALALSYAARYPQRVRGLCLIGVPHYGGVANAARWFRRNPGGWIYTNMAATALACVLTRRVAGRLLPQVLHSVPRVVAEDLVRHHMLSSTTSLWQVLYQHDLAADATALCPSLAVSFIHGSADTTAPIDGARALARTRTGWSFETLEGVDHHPWLRAPQRCSKVVAALLARIEACKEETGADPRPEMMRACIARFDKESP